MNNNKTIKTDEVFTFHFKTRLGVNKKGRNKNRVSLYLSYCEKDYDKAMSLIDRFLKQNDVIIYYRRYDLFPKVDTKEINRLIGQFNANIILVTNNFLESYETGDIRNEFEYISKHHLPLLPILDDEIDLKDYESVFGAIQYIDINQKDKTQIAADKKINDYIKRYIVKTDDYLLAKYSFKSFAFLSYRKKDRYLALDLIDTIHRDEKCRKVAIWYDEFLIAGEKFNVALKKKIKDSSALLILVTPNLVNEKNYIRSVEFPMAKRIGKRILPVEGKPTNEKLLIKQYKDIPAVTTKEAIHNDVRKLNIDTSEDSAEKLYGLGIAYLNGIEVEINRKIAVKYLDAASKKGSLRACRRLIDIFSHGNGVVKDLEKALHYTKRMIGYYKKHIDYSVFNHFSYDYLCSLMEKGNIENYLHFDQIKNAENRKKWLKEFRKFKTCADESKREYAISKLQIYSSLLIAADSKLRSLVREDEYKDALLAIGRRHSDTYDFYSLIGYLSFDLYDKNNKKKNATIIKEIFTKLDRTHNQSPEEACRLLNDGAAYNLVRQSNRFSNVEMAYIFKRFLSYFDYYKDEAERLNKSAELIVDLFDASVDSSFREKQEIADLLISLERVYRRRSKEDSLLLGIYYRLFFATDDFNKQKSYLNLAVKEINELSPNVFNSEPRLQIKYDMLVYSILGKGELPLIERIKEIIEIYKELKNEKKYQLAFDLLEEHVFSHCLSLQDIDIIRYCCSELEELAKHKIDTRNNFIYSRLVLDIINKNYSKFESSLANSINTLATSCKTAKQGKKNVDNFIKKLCLVVSRLRSLSDERINTLVLSTFRKHFKDYIKDSKSIGDYLTILDAMFKLEHCDYFDDCYVFATKLIKALLDRDGFAGGESLSIVQKLAKCTVSLIASSLNKNFTISVSTLNKILDCYIDVFKKIGANNLPFELILEIGVFAIFGGTFNKRDDLWKLVSNALISKNAYLQSVLVTFHGRIIWDTKFSQDNKTKLLKDAIYFISKYGKEPLDKVSLLYKGTFIVCLNLLMNKEFDLLNFFSKEMLNGLPYDGIYFRFYNYLKKFIYFNQSILKIEQEPLIINEEAFPLTAGSLVTESIDLLEVLGYYGDSLDNEELKSLAYKYSLQGSLYMLMQIEHGLYNDLGKIIAKALQTLESAQKVIDDKCYEYCLIARPLFDYADDQFSNGAPQWYLQSRVRFMAIVFDHLIKKEDYDGIFSYFSKFFDLDPSLDFSQDYTNKFPNVMAYAIMASHLEGDKELVDRLIEYGLEYFESHMRDYDLSCFGLFFNTLTINLKNDYIDNLAIITDPTCVDNLRLTAEAYFTLINAYEDDERYDNSILFAEKLIEYLNSYSKSHKEEELLIKSLFTAYIRASMLFEKIGDDEKAFQYKELGKRYLK